VQPGQWGSSGPGLGLQDLVEAVAKRASGTALQLCLESQPNDAIRETLLPTRPPYPSAVIQALPSEELRVVSIGDEANPLRQPLYNAHPPTPTGDFCPVLNPTQPAEALLRYTTRCLKLHCVRFVTRRARNLSTLMRPVGWTITV
jgi:hypothetical protein